MDFKRCENGHYYDAERFDSCPHCSQSTISTVMHDEADAPMYTMPLESAMPAASVSAPAPVVQVAPSNVSNEPLGVTEGMTDDVVRTVGYFEDNDPVVGWLVAIAGPSFGLDFKLKTGRNFIGRSNSMDVALTGDASVSRDKHAIILYEPKGNIFLVQPGDAKELFYLNEKVVLNATEINAYDVLSLGNTKLLFVPCCSDKFNWDSVKPQEEK